MRIRGWEVWATMVLLAFCPTVGGWTISLDFRPVSQIVGVGDPVDIDVFAVSDDADDHPLSAADIAFTWEIGYLQLLGVDNSGAVPGSSAFFTVGDPYALNEAMPPADGDGLLTFFAPLLAAIDATPAGTYLTTLEFSALAETAGTDVTMIDVPGGGYGTPTVVWDGTPGMANHDVTGSIGAATVIIVPEPAALVLLTMGGVLVSIRRR